MMDDKHDDADVGPIVMVPAWAADLTSAMKTGFRDMNSRLDVMESNLDIQGSTVRDVARRMTGVECRVQKFEDRATNNSIRVQQSSKVDMEHESAIAALAVDVASLKATQDTAIVILKRLDTVAANPMVRRIAYAVGAALLTYLASKGWVSK